MIVTNGVRIVLVFVGFKIYCLKLSFHRDGITFYLFNFVFFYLFYLFTEME